MDVGGRREDSNLDRRMDKDEYFKRKIKNDSQAIGLRMILVNEEG